MLHQFKSLGTLNRVMNDIKVKGIDHIAFRSIKHPSINKKTIIPNHAVKQKDEYYFENLNVKSEWYKTDFDVKRIFNSELNLEEFSKKHPKLGDELKYYMINRYSGVSVKDLITYKSYKNIYDVSQFAAWVLIHLDSINHVALEVNDITICEELRQKDYQFVENNHSIYNVSEDKKIIQTSLVADTYYIDFYDGVNEVPSSFVEIIERHRDGFEMKNAQNIFNSTKIQKL